jgi:ligand-binding sensor domain-containing protein/signal transduction histidine kinase/DNA-binding NarL/FixJ family response regulator
MKRAWNKHYPIFLLFIFWLDNSRLYAQPGIVNFKHISHHDGLVQSPITGFLQDDQGFIWFGNYKGLTRYDGYEFKTFLHRPSDTTSLSNNRVNAVFMDSEHIIWIGTSNGLNRFNRDLETFESIYIRSIKGGVNYISCIAEDGQRNLWIGTSGGLKRLNKVTMVLEEASLTEALPTAQEPIYSLYIDIEKNLWIGSKSGLHKFDPVLRKMLDMPDAIKSSRLSQNIRTVVIRQTGNGDMWFGTENSGVFHYDPERQEIKTYTFTEECSNCLASDWVKDMLVYDDNTLWIATQNGISQLNIRSDVFTTYQHDATNNNTLSDNIVRSLMKDRASCIWVGTFSGGIDFFYRGNSNFTNIGEAVGAKGLSHPLVNALVEDSDGSLWVGTSGGGLSHIKRQTDSYAHYPLKSPLNGRFTNGVKSLAVDKENLWIGTLEGLSLLQKKSGKMTHFDIPGRGRLGEKIILAILPDNNGVWLGTNGGGLKFFCNGETLRSYFNEGNVELLADNFVTALIKDPDNTLWVGTQNGISYYDIQNKTFTNKYRKSKESPGELSHNHITAFFLDSKQRMWVGTENGLNYFDTRSGQFHVVTNVLGLPDNFIHAITEDKDKNLWFSTDQGIVKLSFRKFSIPFDQRDLQFTRYTLSDGLSGNQFSNACGLALQTKELAFAGMSGLSIFFPDKILTNTHVAKIALTEILIDNKTLPIGGESPIEKSPTRVDKMILNYDHGLVSFKFAALNYINPQKSEYAIKLVGLRGNDAWQQIGNQRLVNFTNLPPGNYSFQIKASNDNQLWSDQIREVSLIVLPPWWRTWWAYAIYISLAIVMIMAVLRLWEYRRRMRADLQMEHLQNERQRELHQLKMDFFTHISHEIRTPLTLILGPVEKLIDSYSGERFVSKQLQLVRKNALLLMKLVSELMDFRKAEEGHMKLYFSHYDIVPFCKKIFDYFEGLADDKKITYEFLSSEESILVYIDPNQLEKVIFNLLSNAFKFTPNNRRITLHIESRAEWVDINVDDNGKGISKIHHANLFKNFFQADDSDRQSIGSGVGLAFSKIIIELHKGTLHFKSNTWKDEAPGNTTFTISLRKGKDHLDQTQIISRSTYSNEVEDADPFYDSTPGDGLEFSSEAKEKPTILIAEDNDDVRQFIADTLRRMYTITEFANGSDALSAMERDIPDLIISDIMMSDIDGLTLCKSVKSAENTNHIPVILLTARSSVWHQVEGLAAGADAYISKPFNTRILELTIKNLLTAKEIMREKFSQQMVLDSAVPALISNSPEEKFIIKLMTIIESKMEDPEFDVDVLVDEIGMSRSVLYKKVQALTNYSVADLIKEMRLKKAAELFKQSTMTVADVACAVGFNDRKYFSREFRKQYELSPSKFIQANLSKD